MSTIVIVVVVQDIYPETYNAHIGLFDGLLLLRGISKIAIDLYMYPLFFTLLNTFIRRKDGQMQEKHG